MFFIGKRRIYKLHDIFEECNLHTTHSAVQRREKIRNPRNFKTSNFGIFSLSQNFAKPTVYSINLQQYHDCAVHNPPWNRKTSLYVKVPQNAPMVTDEATVPGHLLDADQLEVHRPQGARSGRSLQVHTIEAESGHSRSDQRGRVGVPPRIPSGLSDGPPASRFPDVQERCGKSAELCDLRKEVTLVDREERFISK